MHFSDELTFQVFISWQGKDAPWRNSKKIRRFKSH